jgi:starch-binding outer membrane protein, SusD/RagB family
MMPVEIIFQLQPHRTKRIGNTNAIFLGFRPSDGKFTPDFVPQNWVINMYSMTAISQNAFTWRKNR